MERRISNDALNTAHQISKRSEHPWYICRRPGSADVVVPVMHLGRYMKMDYKILCIFYDGKHYEDQHDVDILLRKIG